MNGLNVLQKLRSIDRIGLVPVVILTSSDEPQDVLTAYRLHANSYIRKPVDFTQFVVALQQIFQYWLKLNLAPLHLGQNGAEGG